MNADDLISTRSLAPIVGVAVITLMRWRAAGTGPKFIRFERPEGDGRFRTQIRYRRSDVIAWLAARKRRAVKS